MRRSTTHREATNINQISEFHVTVCISVSVFIQPDVSHEAGRIFRQTTKTGLQQRGGDVDGSVNIDHCGVFN
jgi:hypothetical protein